VKTNHYLGVATLISGAGTAFAGYLSYQRATSGICAFAEPCPFFLGHPACYTGFALFATAFLVSLAAFLYKVEAAWPKAANLAVAAAGTALASWMTRDEMVAHAGYRLGLPTCAYGLVFFVGLMVWTLADSTSHEHAPRTATR